MCFADIFLYVCNFEFRHVCILKSNVCEFLGAVGGRTEVVEGTGGEEGGKILEGIKLNKTFYSKIKIKMLNNL